MVYSETLFWNLLLALIAGVTFLALLLKAKAPIKWGGILVLAISFVTIVTSKMDRLHMVMEDFGIVLISSITTLLLLGLFRAKKAEEKLLYLMSIMLFITIIRAIVFPL